MGESCDVLVLGGGPAGCAAAILLAQHGHTVALVRPGSPPAAALAQSVPPSAWRTFDELGLASAVERAAFHPSRGNSVWWAGVPVRSETFPEGRPGFNADRAALESVLGAAASGTGVMILDGTTRSATEGAEGWRVEYARADGTIQEIRGTWVVDATGRRGVVARLEGRLPDRSTTTLALVRRWRCPGGWPPEHAHRTLVESYADGWAWSIPLSHEVRCVAAMVDGARQLPGGSVAAMLDAELAKTRHVQPSPLGAVPEGEAWACPASLYGASRFARPGLLLAGDAGSFIDPLSSFGVKKALSSGWLAGVAIHTALVDPGSTAMAVEFFDRREQDVYRRYRSLSAPFFDEAAGAYGTPYWEKRARAARATSDAGPAGPGDPDGISGEIAQERVRSAFELIKARPALDARPSSGLRRASGPGVEGHRIVLQERLVTDLVPGGLRWVRGVDLLLLVATAPGHAEVPDAWTAYNGAAPPVTLPDYLTALATAFAAGFLEHSQA